MKWGGALRDDTKNSCVADYYEGCGFQTVYYGIGYINLDVEGIIFQETVSDQLVDNLSLVYENGELLIKNAKESSNLA